MNGGQEADLSAHGAILLFPSGVGLGAGSALDLAEGRHHAGSRDDIQLAEATAAALISTNHTPEGADGPPGTIARATAAARARAARILTDHRDQVDVLAAALIRRRWLTGRQIHDLLQHRPEKK